MREIERQKKIRSLWFTTYVNNEKDMDPSIDKNTVPHFISKREPGSPKVIFETVRMARRKSALRNIHRINERISELERRVK